MIAYSGDPVAAPKVANDFAKAHDGRPMDPKKFEESQKELTRCIANGHKGVNFGSEFEKLGCLPFCDADNVEGVTRRVNGGYTGLADRKHWLELWRPIIGHEAPDTVPLPEARPAPPALPRGSDEVLPPGVDDPGKTMASSKTSIPWTPSAKPLRLIFAARLMKAGSSPVAATTTAAIPGRVSTVPPCRPFLRKSGNVRSMNLVLAPSSAAARIAASSGE